MKILSTIMQNKNLLLRNLNPIIGFNSLFALISFIMRSKLPWNTQPIVVDIEPTNYCNFRCDHCQVTHWQKPRLNLDFDRYKKIIRQFKSVSRVKLQGMGEPFLNKELPSIIEDLLKTGVTVEVISNGSVSNSKIKNLIRSQKNLSIGFSFDGSDKESFEMIRKRSNFEKVLENITEFAKDSKSRISIAMVAFKENQHLIKPTIDLITKTNIRFFYLQLAIINYGQDELSDVSSEKRVKKIDENDLKNYANDRKIILSIERTLYSKTNPCPWPWLGSYIDVSGNVIPCCRIANSDICSMGNLLQNDFSSIWKSEKYQELRTRIKNNDIPEYCKSCYNA